MATKGRRQANAVPSTSGKTPIIEESVPPEGSLQTSSIAVSGRGLVDCPPEICERIFSFACLDDGFTGRSLSLVSRYIHDTSVMVRYQSVVVEGFDQICALAFLLEKKKPERRLVRHLFLSHSRTPRPRKTSPRDPQSRLRLSSTKGAPAKSEESNDDFPLFCQSTYEQRIEAATRLCALIGSTVETMTIIMPQSRDFLPIPVQFPALVELTVYSVYCTTLPCNQVPQSLPSLQRLHLVGPYFRSPEISELALVAPSLTHLRFSGLEREINVPRIVRRILGASATTPTTDPPELQLRHPRIQKIFIRPRYPIFCGYGPSFGNYCLALENLQELAREFWGEEEVILLSPDEYLESTHDEQTREAKRWWRARLEGRIGCWSDSGRLSYSQITCEGYLRSFV
ncbi:hypothetical protein JAAARDRAFT_30028 [Jaapia argillacea MUCL 33604]|uniref:Uncharacterized protein n=1 Tax=Jaapia argillacea MUCL 33604 TaxID=933084 RepID=A0A067QF41_9AGAM|nr:hypothetical protein JAAARDRAFT_30028 [Jaapia argillacea MUCL 33604]